MSDKQSQQPKRWLVPFPEKKARTGHPCQDACNGNQKMGYLLNYFLCEASWELERQDLPESCKVVKFTRSHEHILKRVNISEKSLVQFLKQFNAWEFVLSEPYSKEFTVQAEPIRKAMYNPVFTKKTRKSCTSTSDNFTTSCQDDDTEKSCNVYLLQQKVEALEEVQLYNITLEARIQALSEALEQESCKVVTLQEKVEVSKLYNSTLSTWIQAVSQALNIPPPIDSVIDRDLRDSNKESNSVLSDDEHAHSLSQNIENDYHSYSTPATVSSAVTTRNEEGDTHAQPLPSVPAANSPHRGSSDVPGDSQMDSTGTSSPLDAPPVDCAQGSDADGGEGRAGVAEDTARGFGSGSPGEAGAAGDTARGQVAEGDDHAPAAPGHLHRDSALPAPGVDGAGSPSQDRPLAAPENGPVLEAGQEEEVNDGRTNSNLADMALADARHDLPGVPDCGHAETAVEQTASREDVLAVAASPLTSSTVEPGHGGWDTVPAAPVTEQQPAQGQEGKRTGKRKAPAKAEEPPKSDTKEVQKRIDTHRGYPLEEKVDIIRERQAVKTWCGLHTIEQYDVVMDELKRDPYWGKPENYFRIGGLTLLRETSRVLAKVERRQASNLRVVPPPEPVDKSKLFNMEHIVLPRKGVAR